MELQNTLISMLNLSVQNRRLQSMQYTITYKIKVGEYHNIIIRQTTITPQLLCRIMPAQPVSAPPLRMERMVLLNKEAAEM